MSFNNSCWYDKYCDRLSRHDCCDQDKYCNKKCGLLYLIGGWVGTFSNALPGQNYGLYEIRFVPKHGQPISWNITNGTLNIPNPGTKGIDVNNPANKLNMQAPTAGQQFQFPLFPLKVCDGDKFEFYINNDGVVPNAVAVSANIDGTIYRTFNSDQACGAVNKIVLKAECGNTIINPSYTPVADVVTYVISENFVAVNPNFTTTKLTWIVKI